MNTEVIIGNTKMMININNNNNNRINQYVTGRAQTRPNPNKDIKEIKN